MLTPTQMAQAEKKLKLMSAEMEQEKKTKQIVKNNISAINDIISSLKNDPKAQKQLLVEISSKVGPKIITLERLYRSFQDAEERMRSDKDRMNKQRLIAHQDRERCQLSTQQINQTIKKIQQTVKSSILQQAKKRQKIQDDLEKSLGQIKEKISTFEKETEQLAKENQTLRAKKAQIQEKMNRLEVEFKSKALQKDEQVKKEKEELMVKLQSLEGQVSEVTQLNKQFSGKQKSNFDKKLSLYLKTKKFPQYSTSFENSAKTIDQCKQQLLKGVQRLNDAKETIEKLQKEAKQVSSTYLLELKKKVEKEGKIQVVKKEKQTVRERIIALQNKLKEKKNTSQAPSQ